MFTKIISELVLSGLTETEIASMVNSTQPSINRIRRGVQNPGGLLAVALVDLHKKRSRLIKQKQAA